MLTFSEFALVDRDQADDAAERVVPAIERQRTEILAFARYRWRRRDPLDDRLENRLDAPASLCADPEDFGRVASEEVREFLNGCFSSAVILDEVPFVHCEKSRRVSKDAGGTRASKT